MEFALEKFNEEFKNEIIPLIEKNSEEVSPYKDIPLSVNWKIYEISEVSGTLRIFTVREKKVLHGYAVFFVSGALHFLQSVQASQDVIYLSPKIRSGLLGYKFIKWCDEQLKKEGVQVVFHHINKKRDFGKVLERMGYELMYKVYAKRLDLGGDGNV